MRAAALVLLLAARASAEDLSVYRVNPAVDLSLTAGLFAASAIPYLVPDLVTPRCPCDPAEVNGFDRVAIGQHSATAETVSDWTLALAVAVPPAADALRLGWGAPLGADVVVFAETLAVNSALVAATKYAVRRPLPLTYEGDPRYLRAQEGYRSFYSGHASTVVAALTASAWTIRWRHGEQVWPWVVDALAGASVGVERVLAGRHFPTDVIVGAAVGFAVGTAVPWLHRKSGDDPAALAPAALGPTPRAFVLSGRF